MVLPCRGCSVVPLAEQVMKYFDPATAVKVSYGKRLQKVSSKCFRILAIGLSLSVEQGSILDVAVSSPKEYSCNLKRSPGLKNDSYSS